MKHCALPKAMVALGASTGGPGALCRIITHLPEDFSLPIVIIQHIEESFIEGFVSWLQTEVKRTVKIAEDGECIESGVIYVASGKGNLEITTGGYFKYVPIKNNQIYTPNIDHFFTKLSELPVSAYAALLTGMGADGAYGLKLLAEKKWNTFVQTPGSCIVSGMPDAALKLSPRHTVVELKHLSQAISSYGLSVKDKHELSNHSPLNNACISKRKNKQ